MSNVFAVKDYKEFGMHVPVYLTVSNPQKYCRDSNDPGHEKLKSSSNSDVFK